MSGPPRTRPINQADNALPVLSVKVTVHTLGYVFQSDKRSSNHASIYLVTPGNVSVQLNMTKAGPTDNMGTLLLQFCPYTDSTSSVRDFYLNVRQGLNVGQVIALLRAKRRDKYALAPSGVGCRFWVSRIIHDFEDNGFISPTGTSNAALATQFLQFNYTREKSPVYEPMEPGRFLYA